MKPSLILRVPEPCNEPWFDMEATQNGRTCARCSKELVDFTGFSNVQLAEFMGRQQEEVCGRFSTSQLNKNLLPTAASYSALTLPALVLLAATITATPVQSQVTSPSTEIAVSADSLNDPKPTFRTISGTLKMANDEEGAYGVVVELRHNGSIVQKTLTDLDGKFQFFVDHTTVFDSIRTHSLDFHDTLVAYTPEMTEVLPVLYLQPTPFDLIIVGGVTVDKKTARKERRAYRRKQRH
jgi:hypothetical protein